MCRCNLFVSFLWRLGEASDVKISFILWTLPPHVALNVSRRVFWSRLREISPETRYFKPTLSRRVNTVHLDRERERGAFQSCGSLLLLLLLFPPSESIVKNFSKCIPAKTLQRSIISSVLFLENAFFIFALGFKVDCAFLNKEKKKSSHVPKKEEKGSKISARQAKTRSVSQSRNRSVNQVKVKLYFQWSCSHHLCSVCRLSH